MGDPPSSGIHVNVNVGVLGHVDCGKTSLVEALSTVLSTCALDKHPQSKARGITLDLGFSCLAVDLPQARYDDLDGLVARPSSDGGGEGVRVQLTLVDCPGHASLIRTIIGATQIIDVFVRFVSNAN